MEWRAPTHFAVEPLQKNISDDMRNAFLTHQRGIKKQMVFFLACASGADGGMEGVGESEVLRRRAGRAEDDMSALAQAGEGFAVFGLRVTAALGGASRHAKEAALKHDLRVMRELIQQYKVDKKKYPESIKGLVEENYLREIPADPITGNHDSWLEVHHECTDPDDPNCDPGVVDVKSGAPGNDVDGAPFAEY